VSRYTSTVPRHLMAVLLVAQLAPSVALSAELTLAEAVRLALTRNERSQIARLNVVSAEAAVTRARAGFLPSITLSGSETLRPFSVEQSGRTTLSTNAASGTLAINQPLFSYGTFPLYRSAKHGRESAQHSEVDQRRQLAFDAARAFFTVIAQQNLLAAAERRLERATASFNDTQARAQAQLTSSNDVTRSRLERASAAQTVATARGGLRQARINLHYVLDHGLPSVLRPHTGQLWPGGLDNVNRLTDQAFAQRPDLAAARATAAATSASAEEPKRRFVPTLGSTAQARVADGQIAGDRYWDTTLTFTLSWSIWDAGSRGADEASRVAAAQTSQLQVKALQRRIHSDVHIAVAGLKTAREVIRAAEEQTTAARQNADESTILYKQGLAKAIELVDANLSRYSAEQALAAAELSLRQAELDLRAALGLFPVDGVK
jgi:outer membrane protein TolC